MYHHRSFVVKLCKFNNLVPVSTSKIKCYSTQAESRLLEESQGKANLLTIGFTLRSFYSLLLKRAVAALQVPHSCLDSSS